MSEILGEGDPRLQRPSAPVVWPDPELVRELGALHRALAGFRRRRGFGRAIAAPQIGIAKRVIAMDLGARALSLVNPEVFWRSDETIELWDDCMSFPIAWSECDATDRSRSATSTSRGDRGSGGAFRRT